MSTKRKRYDDRDDLTRWLQGKTGESGTTSQTTQTTQTTRPQTQTQQQTTTSTSPTSELEDWLKGKGGTTSGSTGTATYYRYMEEEQKRRKARQELEQRRNATYTGSNPVARIIDRGRAAVRNAAETTGLLDRADAEARADDLEFYTKMYRDATRSGSQKLADLAKKRYDETYAEGKQSEEQMIQKATAWQEKRRADYEAWQQQYTPGEYYGTRMTEDEIAQRQRDIARTIQFQQRTVTDAENRANSSRSERIANRPGYEGPGYEAEMETVAQETKRLTDLKEQQARYKAAMQYVQDKKRSDAAAKYSIETMGKDAFYDKARAGKAKYEEDEKAAAARRTAAVQEMAGDQEDFVINSDEYQKIVKTSGGFSLARDDTTDWSYYDITKFYAMYEDDPEQAKAWLEQTKRLRDEQEIQAYADTYGQDWMGRVGAFAISPAISLASGLDPYGSWGQKASRIAEGMQKGVTEGLTEHGLFDTGALAGEADVPGLGKISLGTFAGIGTSMVQSGLVALPAMAIGDEYTAITKTVEFLGTALMGSSAAASDYREKLNAGWSETDAMTHSLWAGLWEAGFEYVSLDKLVDQDVTRGIVRNFFTQGGVEASEEFCTTVANRISDEILARQEGYNTTIEDRADELVAEGYSYEGAMQQAKKEWIIELINDAFAGFVSGGGMTAMHHAAASVEQAAANRSQRAEFAQSVQGTEGAVEAARKYAADRGLKAVKESAGTTRQDARQGKGLQAVQEDITKRIEDAAKKGGVQGANQFYAELVEKYGDGIRTLADAALDSAVSTAVTATTDGRRANAYSVLAHQETVEGIQDERAREVSRGAMERAAYIAAMQSNDEAEWRRASDYGRNHGQEMTMQATVTNEDGSERQVGIESVNPAEGTVKLSGGETVSFDSLTADTDTKDVVQAMLTSDMSEEASAKMLRTFQAQTAEGMVSDPYRWAMDYVTSYDRGRVGSFSLEKAQQSVDVLHADTVKIAYEAGQVVSAQLTQAQRDKLNAALAIQEKGASGRAGSLDVGELAAKIEADEGLKAEVERIRKFAEVFGIDVGLFESAVKNGRYQGENGRYQDGKIWLDINAGRNKVGDVARGMVQTMAHEMTHFMQEYNPEDYAGVKRFVMQQIAAQKGENAIKELVSEKKKRHTGSKPLSTTLAEDEIVADFCADMLTDKAALETMAREDPKGFQALVQWIKDFMQKVFGKLAGRPAGSYEVQVYRSMEQSLRDAFGEAWGKGIVGAVQTHDEVGSLREAERLGASAQMAEEATMQQSDRLDEETLEFLDNQEHVTVYRAMQLIDGQLYPPMAAKVEGKLVDPTEIGKWYQSVERPDLVKNGKFTLNKGNGTSVPAAYNPYFHCSASPLNDQFSSAYKRPNLVVVEGIIPKSELTSGYKAEGAKNSVGETQWHAGPVASRLKGAKARRVFLSRYFQVTRIMSDAEVAGIVAKTLQGENVSIPSNVVTPSLLEALKAQGVAVDETGIERFEGQHKKKSAPDDGGQNSDRDTEYLELAKDPQKNAARLQEMVDEAAREAGYTIKAYHGTPNGTFNVFRNWSYFTEDKTYADVYQNQGASSNGYKKTADKPRTYSVYLNPQNVFDTRTARDRKIFQQQFYRQWGNGAPLSDRSLPDWTDGDDLIEFFDENGYEYDAFYVDEGGTGGYGEDVKDRGISLVVKESSQIKSADPVTYDDSGKPIPLSQRFDPENVDIRYSRRTTPDEGQIGMFGEDGAPVYQEQTKSVRDQFMEVYQELHDKYQNTRRWNGLEFDGLYAEHPEMDFVERFFRDDPKAKADLQQFLETIDDADALEELKYFTTQNRSARQSDHAGAVRKVRNAYNKRIQELGGGNAIPIEHRVYTQAEVRKLFDSMNSNPAVGALAEKVFATAERLGVRYYGANHATGSTNFDGMSVGGDVFLKRSFFANKKYTDQQKAGTILHEMIHACTTYALRGEYQNRNAEESRNLLKAADTLREVFRQAKQEDLLYGEYGLQDVYEFTAELANESFREKLKKVRLWDRVVDAIRKIFGIEKRTALDSASAALEYLLDNVDVYGARTYYREQEFAMRQWEASHDRLRYSMRDNDAPSDLDLLDGFSQNDAENEEQRRLLLEAQASGKKLREAQRQLERLRADMQALAGDNPSRITIQDFRRNVLDLFGIPSSERNGDIGNMVQSIAEGVLAGATLNRDDISFFFQTFVESGTMRTEPDEYLAKIRDDLRGRRVYVNKQVRGDLGEDYAALRKRAFGLGITLTSNEKDMGIDQHFAELAEMYPGAFDSEELDLGTMLTSMIDYAESGKASTVSILDGMRQIEGQTGEPVRDQLQRMYDSFVRHIEIMADRGKLEARARAGNAAEIARAKAKAEKARAELAKVRKERNDWKRKATSAEQRASDKLQAELRKIVKHDAAQIAEAVRQKEALAKKLQQQVEREQKILTGKLNTPQLAKMLKTARETAAQEMAKHKDEVFARAKDRKKASELRKRIKNLSDEMKRRMTRPTDGAYVPASLYGSMTRLADVLDEVLAPNPGTKAAERYKAVLDGIRRMSSEYTAVADLDDPVYSSEYDAEIKADIDAIERTLTRNEQSWLDQLTGNTQKGLPELSTAELQHIYELMKSINYNMKNAAKSLSWNEGKSLYDAMRSVAEQQQELTPLEETGKYETSKRGRLLRKMSTMRAVEMMAGYQRDAALYQLMHGIEQGVVDSDSWVMNYDKAMQPLKNGKNEMEYRKAISKKLDFGATTDRGTKVLMTKMQAIQILMTAEREAHNDKLVHLQRGGAVIRDKSSGKSYTIQVTPELLSRIQDRMTEWDKAYMKAIRDYFGREGKATNEVLYKLKHRVLQTEEYYVPYQVDKNYLETKLDSPEAAMSMWVKTPGSTNALAQKASQPVYIDGMDAVMGHHVKEIANYIGLALAIRDFSKVYNGMLSQGEGENPLPVKDTIHRNFGVDGQKILTQAVIDIQGGRRGNQHRTGIGKFLEAMQSSFYKTALLINPSVTIKQAASYIAIESILDHRAVVAGNRPIFVKADKSWSPSLIAHLFAAPSGATAMRLYNEIDAHTSMHYMRRQGMSMRELASQVNRSGPIARAKGTVGAAMEHAGWIGHKARQAAEAISPLNWIQRMDVATTAAVWVACKEQAKLDGMEVGTDEYWQHVTELYERCLRETQPMYDDLHRNEYQKDREGLMSYLFPFRTVPIQNHGQLANAYENMRAARKSGDKARMKAANRFFRKTVAAQTMSAAVFSVMTFLAAALKRKTKKYRDDDEEISAETIGIGIGKDVVGTLISVIAPLFGSTIWDTGNNVYDAVRTGNNIRSYDSFSVGVVDLLNELETKTKDIATDVAGLIAGNDVDQSKFRDHVMAMVEAGAKCAGIPYTTIKTYYGGVMDNITDILEGRIPALNDEAVERTNAVNAGRYWKAWVDGDDAKMGTVLDEMIQNYLDDGKDEEKAHELTRNALGGAVMDRYTDGELDLQELSDYMEGTGLWDDEKRQDKLAGIIRDELQAGLRDEDETIDLLTDLCGWDEDKAWKKVKEWSAKAEHADDEDYSYSQYDEIDEALARNDNIEALVAGMTDHGVKADSIRSHVKSWLIDNYVKGNVSEYAFKNQLSRYLKITATDDVEKILKDANSKKSYGVAYSSLDEEYRAGHISRTDLVKALKQYGGLSDEDANKKVRWYDLQKKYPDMEITEAWSNHYYDGTSKTQENGHESASAAGMTIKQYVDAMTVLSKVTGTDANGDGKTDTNSKEVAYIAAIDAMNLTGAQKWALYYEVYKGANWKKIAKPNW